MEEYKGYQRIAYSGRPVRSSAKEVSLYKYYRTKGHSPVTLHHVDLGSDPAKRVSGYILHQRKAPESSRWGACGQHRVGSTSLVEVSKEVWDALAKGTERTPEPYKKYLIDPHRFYRTQSGAKVNLVAVSAFRTAWPVLGYIDWMPSRMNWDSIGKPELSVHYRLIEITKEEWDKL